MEQLVVANSNNNLINSAARSCIDEYLNEEIGEFNITVTGECMSPVIKDSENIRIKRKAQYFSGDIVAYYSSVYASHVVHRVLGVIPFQDSVRYFIKADNAFRPDVIVDEQDILGSVIDTPVSIWRRLYCLMQLQYWVVITAVKKILNGLRK